MNLLIVTNNPDRASFRQRIGVYPGILLDNNINCEIAVLPASFLARRKLFMSARNFDGVFLHKKKLNPLDAFVLRRRARKVIYDFDDAVMYSDKHPDVPDPKRLRDFQRTVELADLIIAGNNYLAEQARKFNDNVEILPTGLNIGEYEVKVTSPNDGKIRLVWIGSASTLAYLAELRPVLEQIGRTFDHVLLRIIGDTFFDLKNMAVEKIPWRRETRARQLATADIGLGPLPSNPFTEGKCSFKILEYACSGLPVVASPVGTNGVFVKEGVTGFLASDHTQWLARLSQLIADEQLRVRMGQAGIAWSREFDVRVIGKKLAELIAAFLATERK
jgi:glycosyltransferase involved in cell wall biosynthesis